MKAEKLIELLEKYKGSDVWIKDSKEENFYPIRGIELELSTTNDGELGDLHLVFKK